MEADRPKPTVYVSIKKKTASTDATVDKPSTVDITNGQEGSKGKTAKPKKPRPKKQEVVDVKAEGTLVETAPTEASPVSAKPKRKPKKKENNEAVEGTKDNGSEKSAKGPKRKPNITPNPIITDTTIPITTQLSAESPEFDPSFPLSAPKIVEKPKKVPIAERKPVERPKPKKPVSDLEALRVEIQQLKIRFSDLAEEKQADGSLALQFNVPILDPEFPFDLEMVILKTVIPKGYPKLASPTYEMVNEDVPENLRRQFNSHMDRAAKTLIPQEALRPMIRFLEKNLEMMLTPPANPTGFKFVAPVSKTSAESAAPEPRVIEAPNNVVEYRKSDELEDFELPAEYYEAMRSLNLTEDTTAIIKPMARIPAESSLPLKRVPESRFKPADYVKIEPVTQGAMAGSIQIQFHHLKLNNIGLLLVTQLGVLMKCDRCKMSTPIDDLRPDVDRIYACKKCTVKSVVSYKFDAVHEHSKSAGFLRSKGGMPADMLPSTIQVACGSCAPDDPIAAMVKIEKVQIGENVSFSCRSCHSDCSVEIGRVDWVHIPGLAESTRPKRGAIPKLPSQIGDPLPDRGTCKHYKKSFRWFRFPCCGKAYPCDTCHDEDPSNAGHKAEWASRHICGVCSREFAISQKECPCGAEPANTRRSAHWEGGKGMRDQTQMSKKDNKKYRNLTKMKPAAKS